MLSVPERSLIPGEGAGYEERLIEEIVFIYNADSGFFNAFSDTAHKMLSPSTYQCSLCRLSYGSVGMKGEWKSFLEKLPYASTFLHKDELDTFEHAIGILLPVVMVRAKNGSSTVLLSSEELNGMTTVGQLITCIQQRLSDYAKNRSH